MNFFFFKNLKHSLVLWVLSRGMGTGSFPLPIKRQERSVAGNLRTLPEKPRSPVGVFSLINRRR